MDGVEVFFQAVRTQVSELHTDRQPFPLGDAAKVIHGHWAGVERDHLAAGPCSGYR